MNSHPKRFFSNCGALEPKWNSLPHDPARPDRRGRRNNILTETMKTATKTLATVLSVIPAVFLTLIGLSASADDEIPYNDLSNQGSLPAGWSPGRAFRLPPTPKAFESDYPDFPTPSTNFAGLDQNSGVNPPDTDGAVGPSHLMAMLNSGVLIQLKDGTTISSTTNLSIWWTNVGGFSSAFDPRIHYDPFSQRWIAVALTDAGSYSSSLLIGVSQTSDPSGAWYRWRLHTNDGCWLDFPRVGFNGSKIAVVATRGDVGTGARLGSSLYLFDKASIYAGNTPVYLNNFGRVVLDETNFYIGMVPAVSYDTNVSTLYLVQTYNGNTNGIGLLAIYAVDGTVTAPIIKTNGYPSSPVTWTNNPPSINFGPQLGLSEMINTGDDRIHSPVYRQGTLWCAHTVYVPATNPTRCAIQWWQINPTNGASTQRGMIEDTTGTTNFAYPSIAVNRFNDILIGYAVFSTNQYPSAYYSFHACTDGPGTMQTRSLLKAGISSFWSLDRINRNRWGDYSATVIDPSNDTDLWTFQEYAAQYYGSPTNKSGRWGTWWGSVTLWTPGNDNFTNAFTLTGTDLTVSGTLARATRESGEPSHGANTNTPSVWYNWTAPASGKVSFSATNRGTPIPWFWQSTPATT